MNQFGFRRLVSLQLAILLLIQSVFVTPLFGQSGGPAMPEFQQTSAVGTSNLVDPFSGNFNYGIPLLEIGGFPLTLSYSSDHKMDEEASWVGFGWTLNPGAITRQVRGLPDDFNGDRVNRVNSAKAEVVTTITPGADIELFGAFGVGTGLEFRHSNYWGWSVNTMLSPSVNVAELISPQTSTEEPPPLKEVFSGTPSFKWPPFKEAIKEKAVSFSVGTSISSRGGLRNIQFGGGYNQYFRAAGSIDFGGFTYTPVGELPKTFASRSLNVKVGGKGFFPDGIHGKYRWQRLIQDNQRDRMSQPAYGYLYLQGAEDNPLGIMDYNRERAGFSSPNAPRLPMAYGTPDVFSVSGIGLSGQLTVSRTDIGLFRPAKLRSESTDKGGGFDAALGGNVHVGGNFASARISNATSGWRGEDGSNTTVQSLAFKANEVAKEYAYFHFQGERTAKHATTAFDAVQRERPIAVPIKRSAGGVPVKLGAAIVGQDELDDRAESVRRPVSLRAEPKRSPRAKMVTHLTAGEAYYAGFEREINLYDPLSWSNDRSAKPDLSVLEASPIKRTQAHRRPHHISEIKVTNEGGQRFVYGLPLYNKIQEEVAFSVAAPGRTSGTFTEGHLDYGTVDYNPSDASPANRQGRDRFFDRVTTPAYPNAHLLTAILSPDYVDRQNDGPSQDDLGQYLHIGYSSPATDSLTTLGWRIPTTKGSYRASYLPGNLTDPLDDKASYSYGEKEIAYVHHMDSKTHRAVFYTSDRDDAFPVGENGIFQRGDVLQKLDKIELYTLAELRAKNSDAVPLKTVHFEYAEAGERISPDVPNATAGKLTLERVYFTYENNDRGADHPYVFTYDLKGTEAAQPYQAMMVDRWGNQRPVIPGLEGPQQYPFVAQDDTTAYSLYGLGNLTVIRLPSNGSITVNYEPDDYAYVHDRRAGRMFRIEGFSEEALSETDGSDDGNLSNELYDGGQLTRKARPYLYVRVPKIDGRSREEKVARARQLYFTDFHKFDEIYFDCRVDLGTSLSTADLERVTGYAKFSPAINVLDREDHSLLELRLREVDRNERTAGLLTRQLHPVTMATLTKTRNEMPDRDFTRLSDRPSLEDMIAELPNAQGIIKGYVSNKLQAGEARQVDLSKSYVRLTNPIFGESAGAKNRKQGKIGGGTRVSSIIVNDNWLADDGLANKITTTYDYTTEDSEFGYPISSGVAANEPMVGKEEMLNIGLDSERERVLFAPDDVYRMAAPAGLEFYPGAHVGYSKVTAQVSVPDDFVSKPGKTVHEFYTTRDHPIVVRKSRLSKKRFNPIIKSFFTLSFGKDISGVSQGYTVEVNDMHGKPKRVSELDNSGTLVSSSTYKYSQADPQDDRKSGNKLNALVPISTLPQIGNDYLQNTAGKGLLGLEMDVWAEGYRERTEIDGKGANVNFDFTAPFLIAPSLYPTYTETVTEYKSFVTTKLIRRYGIVEEVVVHKNGSSLSSKNHRWDALTGVPILTSTENEFGQDVYAHTLPAYYQDEHAGMRPAYLTEGLRIPNFLPPTRATPIFNLSGATLRQGDEIKLLMRPFGPYITRDILTQYYHALRTHVVRDGSRNYLVRENGRPLGANGAYTGALAQGVITRSGYRNMLITPAGQTTALNIPNGVNRMYWATIPTKNTVLSSSATVYSEDWGAICAPADTTGVPVCNPDYDPEGPFVPCPEGFDIDFWIGDVSEAISAACTDDCKKTIVIPEFPEAELYDSDCVDCANMYFALVAFGFQADIYRNDNRQYLDAESEDIVRSCKFLLNPDGSNKFSGEELEFDQTSSSCECPEGTRDSDGDGIPDRYDDCPNEAGPSNRNGCPVSEPTPCNVQWNHSGWQNDLMTTVRESCTSFDSYVTIPRFPEAELYNKKCSSCSSIYNTFVSLTFVADTYSQADIDNCRFLTNGFGTPIFSGQTVPCEQSQPGIVAAPTEFATPPPCDVWSPTGNNPNPYITGRRGNWRTQKNYVAGQQLRSSSISLPDPTDAANNGTQPLIFTDGAMESFVPFWYDRRQHLVDGKSSHQLVTEIEKYDDFGNPLESKNALGIHSGTYNGYNRMLATTNAQNARMTDIAFDGFEDYAYTTKADGAEWPRHFGFASTDDYPDYARNRLTDRISHTGLYSLRLSPAGATSTSYAIAIPDANTQCPDADGFACQANFAPAASQRYQASVWVADDNSLACGAPVADAANRTATSPRLKLEYQAEGSASWVALATGYVGEKSPVLEGWQRIILDIDLPAEAVRLRIGLEAPGGGEDSFYFDDFRMYPFEAMVVNYVYHPSTLRLMAQLDENGYAVFYEYDDEGRLMRQKRETERGIMTVSEQQIGIAINPNN